MGPEASYAAVRAVAIAGDYLARERPDEELVVTVQQVSEGIGPAGEELVQTRLYARMEPAAAGGPSAAQARKGQGELAVYVAQATNVGKVAAFVAKSLAEGGKIPALKAVGPAAVAQALKALSLARGFVEADTKDAPEGSPRDLAVTPRTSRARDAEGDAGAASGAGASGAGAGGGGGGGDVRSKRNTEVILRCRRAHPHPPPSKPAQ